MQILWDIPNSNGSPINLYQCFMDDGQGGDLQLLYTGEHPFCEKAGLKVTYSAHFQAELGCSCASQII